NCSSSCLENVKILIQQNEKLLKDLRTSKIQAITYKIGLESVEARVLVNKKNESVYKEDIKLLKRLGYNAIPPFYTGNFLPPKHDLSGLEELVNESKVSEPTIKKHIVETSEATASADKPKDVNNINEETQLHAKVDGKKVVISEASIRRDLQFGDDGGIKYLPNEVIFEQLTLMGATTTVWNEFSSTMASAIICLATNQKLNFSKYIFERTMKHLDNRNKFLMYLRRVKNLKKKHRSRTHKLKRLYKVGLTAKVISSYDDEALDKEDISKQGRIDKIDADEDIALVSTHDDVNTQDNIVQD
nr:hypothetical protein [Tanacetum cinerariifolium]